MDKDSKLSKIYQGWKNSVFKDPKVEVIAKERAETCSECPDSAMGFFTVNKGSREIKKNGLVCTICKCPIYMKSRSPHDDCPKNKWIMRNDKLSQILDNVATRLSHAEQVIYKHRVRDPKACPTRNNVVKLLCEVIEDLSEVDQAIGHQGWGKYSSTMPKHKPVNLQENGSFSVEEFKQDTAAMMYAHQLVVKAEQILENRKPKRLIMDDNSIVALSEKYFEAREKVINKIQEVKNLLIRG